jgi:sigma-B regulation protein RsbU (phosphoserine phosphatase)
MNDQTSTKEPGTETPGILYSSERSPSSVLVVDDSRVVRTYLHSQLENEGYEVLLAKDGLEAVTLLSDSIGIVLLDLCMPGMDGMTCLRHIRENYPDIPVIMITVSHEVANAVKAMKYGAFDYVTKPFNPDALLALVKQAMKSRRQTHRLRLVECELQRAQEHEAAIAARIQQTLLLGGHPEGLPSVKVGELTIASRNIDGDFFDFFRLNDQCFDLIVGDVMGKGVPAALLGAAAKHHFMSVIYRLVTSPGGKGLPAPEEIVKTVHGEMISKMKDLETFFTLCYARFDLARGIISYVDCGHMRTIHFHNATGNCTLLQGVNMPLGFPGQEDFTQIQAPFSQGDLFFFYSDGLTEARNPGREFYGEERLVEFVKCHSFLEPQDICRTAWKEIVEFTGSDTVSDDFTALAVRIEGPEPVSESSEWQLDVRSDLHELDRIRAFIEDVCTDLKDLKPGEERIKMIQIVTVEIVTNIIKHAYGGKPDQPIHIEANANQDALMLKFFDWGIAFDFDSAPPPVFDGSRENGFGLHIIKHTADTVRYSRDETGMNCASAGFLLQRRETK